MINRNLDYIIEQHYASSKNALYLYGARQVGKSYAIRKQRPKQALFHLELPEFMK